MPRPLPYYAPVATAAAVFLLASCGKEEPPAPTIDPNAGTSGASVMLRGSFEIPEGATLEVTQTLAIEDAAILQRIGENEIAGKMTITQTEHQTIRFLEDGGREVLVGEGGSVLSTTMGHTDPVEETQADSLTGKTIVGQPGEGGAWIYSVKGDPDAKVPEGFASADLRADELYPTEWKDFGDIWTPAPSALGALLGPGFQLTKGDIKMRLLAYAKIRGQPCAEVSADIEADGVFRSDQTRQDVSLRLKGKIYRSLHLYQDLEAKLTGSIEMRQRLGNAEVRIEGPVTFTRDASWTAPAPTPEKAE